MNIIQIPAFTDNYFWLMFEDNNKSAVVVEHYGDILYKLGEVTLAVEQWKRAKELGDGSKELSKKITEGKLYE